MSVPHYAGHGVAVGDVKTRLVQERRRAKRDCVPVAPQVGFGDPVQLTIERGEEILGRVSRRGLMVG